MMCLLNLFCVLSGFLLNNFGRRPLLLLFGSLSVLSLLLFIFGAQLAPILPFGNILAVLGMVSYLCCYGQVSFLSAHCFLTLLVSVKIKIRATENQDKPKIGLDFRNFYLSPTIRPPSP